MKGTWSFATPVWCVVVVVVVVVVGLRWQVTAVHSNKEHVDQSVDQSVEWRTMTR